MSCLGVLSTDISAVGALLGRLLWKSAAHPPEKGQRRSSVSASNQMQLRFANRL